MTPEQLKEFTEKFGKEATLEMKALSDAVEKRLNTAFEEFKKGAITQAQFDELKESVKGNELTELNQKLEKLETVTKSQGEIINVLKETGGKPVQKTLEDWFDEQMPKIKEIRKAQTGFFEVTGKELKAAGVSSISGSITDMAVPIGSPYLPGIGGAELQIFDIIRNPNFIINHINIGRTNQYRLAWINEIDYQGVPGTAIAEGGIKPLTQHKFTVEFSTAKKAAAYIELTEEFDNDVPGLATAVRRMLTADVFRSWDDQIQADVIAAAHRFEITQLDDTIFNANLWSALRSMMGQVQYYNFMVNAFAINPLTGVQVDEAKDTQGRYLIPPYMDKIRPMLFEATKVAVGFALVGDLTQYNVDLYKDFTLRIGWINDDFIYNKFAVLGELRYHSYISSARTKALVYDNLEQLVDKLDASGSL